MKNVKLKALSNNFDGTATVEYKGFKYSVSNILEGEEATFDVIEGNKTKLQLHTLLTKSSDRINPKCPNGHECGGCQYLHMSYEKELAIKNDYMKFLFKSFKDFKLYDIIKMNNPYNYRNKSQMTYKLSKTKKVVCGFYEEGTHKIVPVSSCKIQIEESNEIINQINKVLTKNKIMPFDEHSKKGTLKHILVKYALKTKEVMVVFVTSSEMFPGRKNVLNDLLKLKLGITTVIQNINDRDTSIVLGDREKVLYGPGFIYDYIDEFKFKISSKSFYQVNTEGMNILYKDAINKLNITKKDLVLDMYCGVGTIGILMSKQAKEVIGVELNKNAYKDALENAKINHIKNIKFYNEDSTKFVQTLAKNKNKVDLLVLDPPRDGSTAEFITSVGELKPTRIVYVSCEPKTLIKDLFEFSKMGYTLVSAQPVDMFPRTFNIETVVTLSLKQNKK